MVEYVAMHTMRRQDKLISSPREIATILAAGQVCHLALHDTPYPYVVPLNYGYRAPSPEAPKGALFFHGAGSGHKLDLIRRNPRASFVVDTDHRLITAEEAYRFTMHYRSVMGTGTITILESPEDKRHGLDILMNQYSRETGWTYPPKMLAAMAVFILEIDEVSGKQSPPPTATEKQLNEPAG